MDEEPLQRRAGVQFNWVQVLQPKDGDASNIQQPLTLSKRVADDARSKVRFFVFDSRDDSAV